MGFFDYDSAGRPGAQEALVPAEAGFWAHQSSADWQQLFAHTQTLRFEPGQVVLANESTNGSIFIVLAGEARAAGSIVGSTAGSTGEPVWSEGQAIGIGSFFSGRAVREAVVASTDMEVARLTRSALDTILARDPSLALAITFELGRLLALQAAAD